MTGNSKVENPKRIIISSLAALSPLGDSFNSIESALCAERAPHALLDGDAAFPVVRVSNAGEGKLTNLIFEKERYRKVDRVTQLAVAAASETLSHYSAHGSSLRSSPIECVSIGSSRGATMSLESTFSQHLQSTDKSVPTHTSPVTTAGNISSWVAQEAIDRSMTGEGSAASGVAALNTSMTCSSAFHSLLVSLGFVRSGMAAAAIFGGAESCLTRYTLQQLKALRIYTPDGDTAWPGRPLVSAERGELGNTVMLGEGAGTAVVHLDDGVRREGDLELLGAGWQMEAIPSATGISSDGAAFEGAMRRAVQAVGAVDGVIAHAPGSVRGDDAEISAIRRVFGEEAPILSSKHITGHTYGASGMVSLQLAAYLLRGGQWPGFPYPVRVSPVFKGREPLRRILINTAGFGGNVISVVVALA